MNLSEAPFRSVLRIDSISRLSEELRLVLTQLGIESGEYIEKMHCAPLGEPIAIRIGGQIFALRSEVCKSIDVECVP